MRGWSDLYGVSILVGLWVVVALLTESKTAAFVSVGLLIVLDVGMQWLLEDYDRWGGA